MAVYLNRFGPREYRRAEDFARDAASDGTGLVHVVEVFDEETVRIVQDAHLSDFLDEHEGSVQESFGINPGEMEESR